MSDKTAGGFIVTKADLALAQWGTSPEGITHGVRIGPEESQTTNHHLVATIRGLREPVDEWPVNEATKGLTADTVRIDPGDLKATKPPSVRHVPILDGKARIGRNGGGAVIATTDLGSWNVRKVKETEGSWPALEKAIPQGEPIATIGFRADYLAQIGEFVQKFGEREHAVKVEIYENTTGPHRFSAKLEDGREFEVILMTCRL